MTGHRFGKQINLDPMEDTIDWLLNNHSQTSFPLPTRSNLYLWFYGSNSITFCLCFTTYLSIHKQYIGQFCLTWDIDKLYCTLCFLLCCSSFSIKFIYLDACSYGSFMSIAVWHSLILIYHNVLFQNGYTKLHFHQQWMKVPVNAYHVNYQYWQPF